MGYFFNKNERKVRPGTYQRCANRGAGSKPAQTNNVKPETDETTSVLGKAILSLMKLGVK